MKYVRCKHHIAEIEEGCCIQCLREQIAALTDALRDACIGHIDTCQCAGCALAFRKTP